MKSVIERNVKFWFEQTQKMMLAMVGFDVVYTILFNGMMKQNMSYVLAISLIFPVVIPISYISAYIPMLIAFGGTRKEMAIGFQVMVIISGIELVILNLIHNVVFGKYFIVEKYSLSFLISGIIFGFALGQLLGCLGLRFGNKSLIVVAVASSAVCLIIGVIAGAMAYYDFSFDEFRVFLANIRVVSLAVGIILYVISVFVLDKCVKKYEVHYV